MWQRKGYGALLTKEVKRKELMKRTFKIGKTAITEKEQKFKLGKIVVTEKAEELLVKRDIEISLSRHRIRDWGGSPYSQENDLALKNKGRIISIYYDCMGTRFGIITDIGRSVTTVLLPDDFTSLIALIKETKTRGKSRQSVETQLISQTIECMKLL